MRERAREWLRFSLDDLEVAREAAKLGKYNIAAYHLQQAVEKAIKGVIVFIGKRKNLRTHDISVLVKMLVEEGVDVPVEVLDAQDLTEYASTTRYPDDYVPVSEEEYEEAYEVAVRVYEWAKGIVEGQP